MNNSQPSSVGSGGIRTIFPCALYLICIVALSLAISAKAQSGVWTNLAGGSWAAAANWSNSVVAGGADNSADFSELDLTADATVNLDGARTVGNLIFGDSGAGLANNWTLATGSGGPLTLSASAGEPVLTANNGSNNIALVLADAALPAGITKNGNGLIRLSAGNLITNITTSISAGILQLGNSSALGTVTSGIIGTNNVSAGATLQILAGVQPANQRIFISGAGQGGTNGALRADAGSGNNQNTRWSYALNSAANPAIILTGDATIRVDGTGYGSQAGFLVGAITNDTSGLAYTLTKTGSGELRIDPAVEIGVSNIHVAEGVFGVNGNGGNPVSGITTVTVDSGAALGARRNRSLNSSGVGLILNGILDMNYNPGATANTSGNSWSDIIGYLSGNGFITNSSLAPQLLYVTGSTSNSVFNGIINPGPNGAISLRKEGQGAAMWLNGSCTFPGTNIIAGGIQYVDGAWNPMNGGFVVSPQSGATTATLAGNGSTMMPIALASGGYVSAGDPSNGGGTLSVSNITGAGGVIISNANLSVAASVGNSSGYIGSLYITNGTLTLPLLAGGASAFVATMTVDGAATISYTVANPTVGQFPLIQYSSLGGLAGGGTNGITLISPAGTAAYLSNNVANNSLDVIVTGIPALTWNGNVNGDWDLATTANWLNGATPATYTETAGAGPFVMFDDSASGTTSVNITPNVNPKGMTANNSSKNYTISGNGIINSPGNLLKQGSGTLTLANTNNFVGGATISAGVLQLGNGGTTGSLSGAIANSGQLTLNRSDSFSVGPVSGSGNIVKQNSATATVSVNGDIGGAVTINGGNLTLSPSGNIAVAGSVTGAGVLGVSGSGTLVLENTGNTYAGGTTIQNGTLQIGDTIGSGSLPSGSVTDNGTLAFGSSATVANTISGTGGISILNSAGITLSGPNTYAGPTVVAGNGSLTAAASNYGSGSVLTLGSIGGAADIGSVNFSGGNPVLGGLNAGGNSYSGDSINLIGGNQTLFINGNVKIGNVAPAGATVYFPVTGSGVSVVVNTNGGVFQIGLGAYSSGVEPDNVFADFSGIDNFVCNLGTNGALNIGTLDGNPGPPAGATVVNQFNLANLSNYVAAGSVTVGAGGRQLTPDLRLGPGTNIFNVGTFNVGTGSRDGGTVEFNTGSGGLQIRGFGGGSNRANYNQGANPAAGTGASFATTVDFTGGVADLLFNQMIIGNEPVRVGNWTQTFTFTQGTLDASGVSLSRGCRSGTTGSTTMNINGGTAMLGTVSLTASPASGTLNISGASVTVNGIAVTGSGTSALSIANSGLTLSLTNTGNPVSAPIFAKNVSINGTVNLNVEGNQLTVGQFPLVGYTGLLGGGGFASLVLTNLPSGVSGYLSNNTTALSVDLVITNAPVYVNVNPTNILFSVSGGNLNLSWPADHTGWRLQVQTNSLSSGLSTNWYDVGGSTNIYQTNFPINLSSGSVFYRLVYP
ncbi:MAG TPA: autotransporter-associated beta strand repeat-containing protein [Verrucomicrobiae bacterium]|nr:autotransporter-associated beta strand repeat-containing protein [Verrucomicrobiae bacterium]